MPLGSSVFYILPENGFEGSYRTNPILEVTEPYAYEGLKVVIPVSEDKNTVIGPFTVEWRDHDSKLVIRTGLQTPKALLFGYHFPTNLSEYTQQVGRYGEELSFIHLDKTVCKERVVDVITKEQLLNSFRDTLNSEGFVNGKIDFNNIGDLIAAHKNSPFMAMSST